MYQAIVGTMFAIGLLVAMQAPPAPPVKPTPTPAPPVTPAPTPPPAPPAAPTLKMPDSMTVSPDDQFVILQATWTGKGSVKFTAISFDAPAFKVVRGSAPNSVVVGIPKSGVIHVLAVAAVGDEPTDFAETVLTVQGTTPAPTPGGGPTNSGGGAAVNPLPAGSKLYVSVIEDAAHRTPAIVETLTGLASAVKAAGHRWADLDKSDAKIGQRKLDGPANRAGLPALVIQGPDGAVLESLRLPGSSAEAVAAVGKWVR
jgi:hypothetical protein